MPLYLQHAGQRCSRREWSGGVEGMNFVDVLFDGASVAQEDHDHFAHGGLRNGEFHGLSSFCIPLVSMTAASLMRSTELSGKTDA